MLRIKVKFDKIEEKGSIKLDGYIEEYPKVGKSLSIQVFKNFSKVIVDFGRVYNIESIGDILLVQTEWVVAEIIFPGETRPTQEESPVRELKVSYGVSREKVNELLGLVKTLNRKTKYSGPKLVKGESYESTDFDSFVSEFLDSSSGFRNL